MSLKEQIAEAGNKLLQPPSSLDELLPLLDQVESSLLKVEQSPGQCMDDALSPLMKALVANDLLRHSDLDVKAAVASCISEITRITAPDAPYDDDKMKDVFQLIVSSFENLHDQTSRSYNKRVLILETVATVKSFVLMLDLECGRLITEMFQHFLKAIREYHTVNILSSMATIMTLVLEESEEVSLELLTPLLASVKKDKEVTPAAKMLGKIVFANCAAKLKPCLKKAVESLNISLAEYSKIVTLVFEGALPAVDHANDTVSKDLLAAENKLADLPEAVQPTLEPETTHRQSAPKESKGQAVNVAPSSPGQSQPDESVPKKAARSKKESLNKEDSVSKKGSEATSDIEAKQARRPLKKALLETSHKENEGGSSSNTEAKKQKQSVEQMECECPRADDEVNTRKRVKKPPQRADDEVKTRKLVKMPVKTQKRVKKPVKTRKWFTSLGLVFAGVWSDQADLQLLATQKFRQLFRDLWRPPPMPLIIKFGVIPRFDEFLGKGNSPILQREAALALIDITSEKVYSIKFLMNHKLVEILIKVLDFPDSYVRDQAVLELGRIAELPEGRDLVHRHEAVRPLLEKVFLPLSCDIKKLESYKEIDKHLPTLRIATYTLLRFCKGASRPDVDEREVTQNKYGRKIVLTPAGLMSKGPHLDKPLFMEDNDEEPIEESISSSTSKRQRTNSVAWEHFEKLPLDSYPDCRLRGKRKKCGRVFLADLKAGTTSLHRHHAKHQVKASQVPVDHEQYRFHVSKAIVRHNYPFSFVEHEGNRELHLFLNPTVKTLSRNTARADVCKLYQNEKEILKNELASIPSRVCLTSDLWTSITSDGYMCVTAHYVDLNWVLQKKVLIFRHVPPPHSGAIIGPTLINMLQEWGIEKKVFSITLDNATYNEGVVDRLIQHFNSMDSLLCKGDFVHIRCANHILNLVVKEGLKTINTAISNIRESIKYVRGSESRMIKFVECIKNLGLKMNGKVRQDVSTRWNYTFLMLDSAIPYRRAFSDFKLLDSEFTHCPSKEDWVQAEIIAEFLKPFYVVTTLFSGNQYPTANLYFHKVWKIHMMIREERNSMVPSIKKMAIEMEKKFKKYWQEDYTAIASMAVAVDPRYKLKLVKYCFNKLDPLTCNEKVKVVEDNMRKLFKEYLECPVSDVGMPGVSTGGHEVDMMDELEEFDMFESPSEFGTEKTQLDLFLEEPVLVRKGNENLDVLKFWKDNRKKYPELSLMARDLLSIPITTVASESTFSIGGRMIGKYQSSILPENAEAKLCSRDWLYGHQDSIDSDDEDDDIAIDVEKIAAKFLVA